MGVRSTSDITREDAIEIIQKIINENTDKISNEKLSEMLEIFFNYDNFSFVKQYGDEEHAAYGCPMFEKDAIETHWNL